MRRYRALKVFRWGGALRHPGEIIDEIPGRRMDAMVERGAVERIELVSNESAQPVRAERPTVEPETTVGETAQPSKPAASTTEDAKPKTKRKPSKPAA